MEPRFFLVFALSVILLSSLAAAQDGTTNPDGTTNDGTAYTTPDYENMTLEELIELYHHHLNAADRILLYIPLPPEERPPELQNRTVSELYMLHEIHMREAENIYVHIQMREEEMANEEPPSAEEPPSTDIPSDETNATEAPPATEEPPPDETAPPEGNETSTDIGNETGSTDEDNAETDLNDTGVAAGVVPNETRQVNVTKEQIDERRERMTELRREEWLRYRTYMEYREAIGQAYEEDVVTRIERETGTDLAIERISAGNAVRIQLERDTGAIDAVTGRPRENITDIPLTFIDFSVKNRVENIGVNVEAVESIPETTEKPTEVVYDYIEIDKQVLMEDEIEDIGIGFRVEKSWLYENNIRNHSQVSLFRLVDEEWTELPTRKVSEDEENVYYEALSPGFSYFAIGITAAIASPIEIEIPGERDGILPETGSGESDDIMTIRFSWVLVIVIISVIIIFKYTYISRQLKGLFRRESLGDLQKMLTEFKSQKDEALNQYYKREITEVQMNQIVNGIKKKEFDVQMRIKKLQEKKQTKTKV